MTLLFIDALPSVEYRRAWRERARLRWHLEQRHGAGEQRVAFADKLTQLIGPPASVEPTW